jgi:hypothetical protein
MDMQKHAALMRLEKSGELPSDLREKIKEIRITSAEVGYYFVFNKRMTGVRLFNPQAFSELENDLLDVGGWAQVDEWDINY